jgi:hypothetical protein
MKNGNFYIRVGIESYFDRFKEFTDFVNSQSTLLAAHDFVVRATSGGKDFKSYYNSESIKKTIDLYLSKINEHLAKAKPAKKNSSGKTNKVLPQENPKPFFRETDILNPNINQRNKPPEKKPRATRKDKETEQPILVERIPDELRFIRRFINLNGKTKTKDELLRFINSLQKAIVEKRIRKTSTHAEHIRYIQSRLITTYNGMKAKVLININPDTYETLKKVIGGEKVLASTNFIKRYIGLNGKTGVKEKAKQLLTQINNAITKGKIPDGDPYSVEMYEIKKNLHAFITGKEVKTLEIERATLNGLEGILGCACQTPKPKPTIMSSVDFADLEFDTIGLKGKWYHLIGDPSPNFKGMISGKPKLGKSTLCIEFAGYLARHHGKVLYVAKEEGLDYTLQQKLNSKDVVHPNLDVASVLPESLAPYDFIFIDSVTRMNLKPEDLDKLEKAYPSKAFLYVFQTTKDGKFRGANAFQHNVDVVIEVPEKGKAVQMGRFNQGGEIDIFNSDIAA